MKKLIFYLLCILSLSTALTSCKDDKEEPVYGEAKMISFGFYVEDNQGKIFKDYAIENVTNDISILLPSYVDKSALVARFVVTDKDVVTVGTVTQESKKTVNNFTVPVDYIVTEGKNNAKFTVTVGKQPDAVWTKVTSLAKDMRELLMRVNPKTNVPYIVYVQNAATDVEYKTGLLKLDQGQLVSVGSGAVSSGRSANCSLAFSTDGTPYISFSDYSNTVAQSLSVMSWNGSAWDFVGGTAGKGVTDVKTTYTEIVLKADGKPMCFSVNDADGVLKRRELNISEYTGSWKTSTAVPGRLATQSSYFPKAKLVNGVLYLGVYNVESSIGTFSVYKYENNAWITIVNAYLEVGAKTAYMRDFDLAVDSKGVIYIAYADDQAGVSIYRPKVKKFDPVTKVWTTLATPIAVDFATTREISLAVSPAGIPFLLYRNNSKFPEVVSYDNETKAWTTPVVLDNIETEYLNIDFAPNGTGYAVYSSVATDGTYLSKFDVPAGL